MSTMRARIFGQIAAKLTRATKCYGSDVAPEEGVISELLRVEGAPEDGGMGELLRVVERWKRASWASGSGSIGRRKRTP